MAHFVGLDVSVKETAVCVVDEAGKVLCEQKVPSEPDDIVTLLTSVGVDYGRVGIEAGLMVDVERASDGLERMNIVELLAADRSTNDEERLGHAALGEIASIGPDALDRPGLRGDLTRALTVAEKLNCGADSVASGAASTRASHQLRQPGPRVR